MAVRFAVFCFLLCLPPCEGGRSRCGVVQAGGPSAADSAGANGTQEEIHRIELSDPVLTSLPAKFYPVRQFRDRDGFPAGYALALKTEVCIDKKCKTVDATIYWNALGYYERFEYPPGKPLTKKEHVPFEPEDYDKLDGILKDPNSILRRHSLAFLAKPVEQGRGVDGWSGATPATVQASVVKDAAFTSWVMWRWANGEIVPKLRRLTEQGCTPRYLKQLLASDDRRNVDFALSYVTEHHGADVQFADDVFFVLENGGREHVTLALRFLSGAMKDRQKLHARLVASCGRMKSIYSPMVLDFLSAQPDLPPATCDELTGLLGDLPYFQVHLILKLLEQREFFSAKTESDVSRLLDDENFFIARRASEYLLKQDLGGETENKLNAFRERNRDRL